MKTRKEKSQDHKERRKVKTDTMKGIDHDRHKQQKRREKWKQEIERKKGNSTIEKERE